MVVIIKPKLIFVLIIFCLSQNIYAEFPKIEQIDQVLGCKDCCLVNDTFCKIFYLSCNTKSLEKNNFLQANKSLDRDDIAQIIIKYFKSNIKNIVLVIPDADNIYLIRKYFKRLKKELRRNIKKLDRLNKINNSTIYQEYRNKFNSIQYLNQTIKIKLTQMYNSEFTTLLEEYKSLVARNNFPKQITFLNRNNTQNCEINKSSPTIMLPNKTTSTSNIATYSFYKINYTPTTKRISIQLTASSAVASTEQQSQPVTASSIASSIQPTISLDVSSTDQKSQSVTASSIASSSMQPTAMFIVYSTDHQLQSFTTSLVESGMQPITKISKSYTPHTGKKITTTKLFYMQNNNISSTAILNGINRNRNNTSSTIDSINNNIVYIVVASVCGFIIVAMIVAVIYKYHSIQKKKQLHTEKQKNTVELSKPYNTDLEASNE